MSHGSAPRERIADQPSQTLAKALCILDLLCSEPGEWGIRELGRELDMNPASIHRLVKTLHNYGYTEQNPENQRYSVGPRVMRLASAYAHRNPLPTVASKVFETYADRFEYNFYLGVLSNDQVVYLAALDGRGPIKIAIEPGASLDLHAAALGKLLLAYQPDDYIEKFLATHPLRRYTDRTITDPQELKRQLVEIRQHEFAINRGEYYRDIGAVGVPARDGSGHVFACVSLTYPQPMVHEGRINIEELVVLAHEISDEIVRRTGSLSSASGQHV